jgi:hypothetical protein
LGRDISEKNSRDARSQREISAKISVRARAPQNV